MGRVEWCAPHPTSCANNIEHAHDLAIDEGLEAVNVYWLTQSSMTPPATQCKVGRQLQAKHAGLYEGTDWYDGSHIVCAGPQ